MTSTARDGTPASSNYTTAPTKLTPDSDSEDLNVLHDLPQKRPGDSLENRRLRRSHENPSANSESSDSDEDDDKEESSRHIKLKRVGTLSKDYTDEEEKTVVRKFDRRLVLFVALLYMLSFLDRSNIGNARIAGLDTALSLSSSQYSWLLTAFYITYIAFEWMILLYRVIPPHIYISACVLSWGLLASLQSICTSFNQLVVLRGLLGVSEAAFGPGVPFYLSFFYRRSELAYRVGLQISAAPLATSFASSLAWVIVKVSQNGPIEPWRALFLVEGFPSIMVAIFAWYIIPDSPSAARYLTPRERKVATLRLRSDQSSPTQTSLISSNGINKSDILTTLLDPKAYLTAFMFLSVNVAFSSLPVFLPSVLNDMSFSPLASQALAAPPYLCAFGFVLIIGHYSDRIPDSRAWFIVGVSLLSSISYASIALAGLLHESLGIAGTITIRYIGVYGAAMGFFSAVTLIITWVRAAEAHIRHAVLESFGLRIRLTFSQTLNNQQSATGKGMGMTILNVIGQCGPLVGVHLFPKSNAPYYVPGMAVCSGFMLGVASLALVLRFYLVRLNRRTDSVGEYEMVGMAREGAEENLMGKVNGKSEARSGFIFML